MGKAEKWIAYTAMGAVLFIAGMAWQDVEQLEDFHTFLHETGHVIFGGGGEIAGAMTYYGQKPFITAAIGSLLGLQLYAWLLAGIGGKHFPPLAFFGAGWSFRTTVDVFAFPAGQFWGDQRSYTAAWYPVAIACSAMVVMAMIYGIKRKRVLGLSSLWEFWTREYRAYQVRMGVRHEPRRHIRTPVEGDRSLHRNR